MAHRAPQDHRRGPRLALPGPRTRLIVAAICGLLSVGAPVMLLGTPGLTVDGQPAGPPEDPAGLGITGALPGDPSPSDLLPGDLLPGDLLLGDLVPGFGGPGEEVPGDSAGAGPSEFSTPLNLPEGPLGIPGVVLGAYQFAERTVAATQPGCHLSWSVLAGIGRIESGHARGGRVDAAGSTLGPILGVALDGSPGVAAIADTDRGVLDQDTVWDRAVGPMQFIPTSWRGFGVDGNGDGVASPHNIYDATFAAGRYLCAGGGDLTDPAQLQRAVFRYNHSTTYVTIVLRWAQAYLSGVVPTVPAPGPVPPATNGNGGVDNLAGGAPPGAAPPAVIAQPAPLPPAATTNPPPPPPPATTTTPPATTTSSPPPPPPPPAVITTTPPVTLPPPVTVTTTPLPTTTPPVTDSNPPPPPQPTTTTTPVEPALGPPPPPSLEEPCAVCSNTPQAAGGNPTHEPELRRHDSYDPITSPLSEQE